MHFGFFRTLQLFLLLANLFFYWTLVRFLGITGFRKLLGIAAVLLLLCFSFTLSRSFLSHVTGFWARVVYTISVSWLGFSYLFLIASILCWVFWGITRLARLPVNRKLLMEILLGLAVFACVCGVVNADITRTTRIDLRIQDLPLAWRGKTAVLVSDTHLGLVRNRRFAERICTLIQNLKPDIVLIGGDLFDGQTAGLDEMIEPFSKITAPYGIYFVTGNHEEFGDKTPYLNAIRRAGIRVLNNEMIVLDGLQVIGVDYADTRREDQFKKILDKIKIDRRRPSLLLKHTPLNLQVAQEQGITAQLSGHTHHGQLLLIRYLTARIYKGYDYGLKWFNDLQVYTSSGAGTVGPPMRIDTAPEIVQITFR
jgi:predicted MPP superfamily phosphohydrolase